MKKNVLFTLTSHIQDLLLFQAQLPSNSSRLVARTQNEIKGFVHLNCTKSQSQHSFKRPKMK
jgi:hypothetical protein